MDASFILAAAEAAGEHAAEEEHRSELPFFIAGAVLVLFAFALSVVGFKRPDFPGTSGAARGVMALTVALVLATMGSIIYVSG